MKIKSVSFENYKAFEKRQEIALKPITILIGKNSSGKSSIAKLFTLFENSLSGKINEPLLLVNNNVELGGEFIDLVHNRQPNVPIKFNILFDNDVAINISIVQVNSEYNTTIFKWEYYSKEFQLSLTYNPNVGYVDSNDNVYQCEFSGFIPTEIISETDGNIINRFNLELSIDVDYIGPFRVLPKRQFHLTGQLKFDNTGAKGENAYPILGVSKVLKKSLDKEVGEWYRKNFNGWELEVEDKNRPFIEINLIKNSASINIVDVGQGMNQALPLVVRSHIAKHDSLIILEQPELHLHPAAHGSIGELFARSAKKLNQSFIIETHSENIILRMRKLIVENDFYLTSDDVVIYWIDDEDPLSPSVKPILIDSDGVLSDWPTGVFNENLLEIQEIMKAVSRKKGNDN